MGEEDIRAISIEHTVDLVHMHVGRFALSMVWPSQHYYDLADILFYTKFYSFFIIWFTKKSVFDESANLCSFKLEFLLFRPKFLLQLDSKIVRSLHTRFRK